MAAGISVEAPRPADRTVVYLVRHGQTPLNESGALRGLLDPPLDETGHQQASRLADALGRQMPSAVIASPLLRATQTAQPVADRAGLDVATDERLLDRDYGQWAGIDRDKVVAEWGSVDNAPGVEPLAAVRDRAVRGLTDIGRRSHGGTVVVVSHDAVNRQVLVALDPQLGDPGTLPQDNGCFNTLELRSDGWTVLNVNELPAQP
jgi:broad specificity phosphatase PhoE